MATPRLVRQVHAPAVAALLVFAGLQGGCGPRGGEPRTSVHGTTLPATQATGGAAAEPSAGPKPTGGRLTRVTLYHLAAQKCPDPPEVALPRCGGGSLASVSHGFLKAVRMQGSAKLCDGRVVGVQKLSPLCFVEVPTTHPWGMTASGRPAVPFRSIAIDPKVFRMGHWYYVPELDGLPLPAPAEGKLHDGCVHADDRGGAVKGDLIDLFVGSPDATHALATKVNGASFHLVEADTYCAYRATPL